jgi:hypothetical protein
MLMAYWKRCKSWCVLEDSHVAPMECSEITVPKETKPAKPYSAEDEKCWQRLAAAFKSPIK